MRANALFTCSMFPSLETESDALTGGIQSCSEPQPLLHRLVVLGDVVANANDFFVPPSPPGIALLVQAIHTLSPFFRRFSFWFLAQFSGCAPGPRSSPGGLGRRLQFSGRSVPMSFCPRIHPACSRRSRAEFVEKGDGRVRRYLQNDAVSGINHLEAFAKPIVCLLHAVLHLEKEPDPQWHARGSLALSRLRPRSAKIRRQEARCRLLDPRLQPASLTWKPKLIGSAIRPRGPDLTRGGRGPDSGGGDRDAVRKPLLWASGL